MEEAEVEVAEAMAVVGEVEGWATTMQGMMATRHSFRIVLEWFHWPHGFTLSDLCLLVAYVTLGR